MKPGTKVALLVVALFSLMACAWMTLFYVAGRAQVKSVPMGAPASVTPEVEPTQTGWNALTPTRSDRARRRRVKRLGGKTLHPSEGI